MGMHHLLVMDTAMMQITIVVAIMIRAIVAVNQSKKIFVRCVSVWTQRTLKKPAAQRVEQANIEETDGVMMKITIVDVLGMEATAVVKKPQPNISFAKSVNVQTHPSRAAHLAVVCAAQQNISATDIVMITTTTVDAIGTEVIAAVQRGQVSTSTV